MKKKDRALIEDAVLGFIVLALPLDGRYPGVVAIPVSVSVVVDVWVIAAKAWMRLDKFEMWA